MDVKPAGKLVCVCVVQAGRQRTRESRCISRGGDINHILSTRDQVLILKYRPKEKHGERHHAATNQKTAEVAKCASQDVESEPGRSAEIKRNTGERTTRGPIPTRLRPNDTRKTQRAKRAQLERQARNSGGGVGPALPVAGGRSKQRSGPSSTVPPPGERTRTELSADDCGRTFRPGAPGAFTKTDTVWAVKQTATNLKEEKSPAHHEGIKPEIRAGRPALRCRGLGQVPPED